MKNLSIISSRSKSANTMLDLLKVGGYDQVKVFYDYLGFVGHLTSEKCDLALFFLDRNNGHINKAAEFLSTNNLKIPYIFCVKNRKNSIAVNYTKYKPYNIIYEPFSKEQLSNILEINYTINSSMNNQAIEETEVIEKVGVELNTLNAPISVKNNYAFFKSGIDFIKVFFAEIMYIQSDHVYVFLITANKKIPLRAKLEDIENYLPSTVFQRIHQRYVVNIDHITRVNTEAVYLGNIELPLSKKYKKTLLKHMNIFS